MLYLEFSSWTPSGNTLFLAARLNADSDSEVNRAEEKKSTWDNSLQNFGHLIQLVKLLPRRLKKLNIKNISVGKPLENSGCYL